MNQVIKYVSTLLIGILIGTAITATAIYVAVTQDKILIRMMK